MNRLNSSEVNCGPLSLTIFSGRLLQEKIDLRAATVFSEVVNIISITSGHFEWTSTTISNIKFINDPVKSICNLFQGADGHSQGLRGACGGSFRPL